MLAEIFMLRLEIAARLMQEILPSSTSRFVPFSPETEFAPTEIGHTQTEATMEEPRPPLVGL
jgi:hypothetical protein